MRYGTIALITSFINVKTLEPGKVDIILPLLNNSDLFQTKEVRGQSGSLVDGNSIQTNIKTSRTTISIVIYRLKIFVTIFI